MICEEDVRDEIYGLVGVKISQPLKATWKDHVYSCTYVYPNGKMTLSVKELANKAETDAYYASLATKLHKRKDVAGFPEGAFITTNDSAVVRKDYKVLTVDAAGLPAQFGESAQRPGRGHARRGLRDHELLDRGVAPAAERGRIGPTRAPVDADTRGMPKRWILARRPLFDDLETSTPEMDGAEPDVDVEVDDDLEVEFATLYADDSEALARWKDRAERVRRPAGHARRVASAAVVGAALARVRQPDARLPPRAGHGDRGAGRTRPPRSRGSRRTRGSKARSRSARASSASSTPTDFGRWIPRPRGRRAPNAGVRPTLSGGVVAFVAWRTDHGAGRHRLPGGGRDGRRCRALGTAHARGRRGSRGRVQERRRARGVARGGRARRARERHDRRVAVRADRRARG